MEERRINWRQILATVAMTGLVAIITGTILSRLQAREPLLVYSAAETSSFEGSDRNFAII